MPMPQGLQPPHSLRRSPRFMSPACFMKADGTKFSFDDLDFPAELDSNTLEFVSGSCCVQQLLLVYLLTLSFSHRKSLMKTADFFVARLGFVLMCP